MSYALKRVKLKSLKEKEIANAINEVRILASIRHQNVIAYKEAFMEPKTESLWYEIYKLLSKHSDGVCGQRGSTPEDQ